MSLEVDLGDLVASGASVSGLGEDLAAQHFAADGRIDAALPGWQGLSATAMGATAEHWTATTGALLARLCDHAQALDAAAEAFADHEHRSAAALDALH